MVEEAARPGDIDFGKGSVKRVEEYGRRPTFFQWAQFTLAISIIGGFAVSTLLVLWFVLESINRSTYQDGYLAVLGTVGSLWAGLTGAVVGFYFGAEQSKPDSTVR